MWPPAVGASTTNPSTTPLARRSITCASDNAAMMANGMTGRQIADQWRQMDPRAFTTLDWRNYYKLLWMRAVATDDGLKNTFRNIWKLDFNAIRRRSSPEFSRATERCSSARRV